MSAKVYKVLMSEELWNDFGFRNSAGDRLTFDWGEPDEEGFYTPTVTAYRDTEALERLQSKLDQIAGSLLTVDEARALEEAPA